MSGQKQIASSKLVAAIVLALIGVVVGFVVSVPISLVLGLGGKWGSFAINHGFQGVNFEVMKAYYFHIAHYWAPLCAIGGAVYTFISSSSNVARAPRGSRTLPSQKVSTVSTQFDLSGGQKEYTLSEGWLDQLDSMSYNVVNVHGTPGQGLDESGFGEGLIAAGQLGEQRLAKLFVNEGVTASWDTYWSLRLPDSDWDTDVDCLLYRHGTIYLVDAKNYNVPEGCTLASDVHLNPVTSEQEYGIKVLDSDGTPTGKTYKMTKNMAMAIDKFKKAFPGTQILAAVVLTPISHTVPGITGKVVYPGDIPLFQSNTFIQMLQQTYGTQEAPIRTDKDRIVAQKLTELLKQKTLDSDSRIESIVSPQEKQANASQNSLETDNELGNM